MRGKYEVYHIKVSIVCCIEFEIRTAEMEMKDSTGVGADKSILYAIYSKAFPPQNSIEIFRQVINSKTIGNFPIRRNGLTYVLKLFSLSLFLSKAYNTEVSSLNIQTKYDLKL